MTRHHPRRLSQIIEDQFHLWSEASKQSAVHKTWPLITISRQYSAGGTTIGRHLSRLLNFPLWDQELVHAIAEDAGVSAELISSYDEHWPNTLNELISTLVIGAKGTEAEYVRQIYRIIHTLEKRGRGVVIGRGGQFIVKEHKALKVRCVAPLEVRVERVMTDEKLQRAEALKKITSIDRDRVHFHKHYFAKDVEDPCHYHLVINTGAMSSEQVAKVIVNAYQQLFGNPA